MPISERIEKTAESWSDRWKDLIGGWLSRWLAWGLELLMDVLGKAFAPVLSPLIERLERDGKIPTELQPLFNEIKSPTGQIGAVLAQSAGGAAVSGGLSRILDILLLPVSYSLNEATPTRMPNEDQLIAMWLRDIVKDEDIDTYLSQLGDNPLARLAFKELSKIRVDPMSWITALRRKYERFTDIEQDLRDQGWTPDRIEALKFVTLYYPSPGELVHWQAREVFEPEMIARYGLDDEYEAIEKEPFYKAGMTDEQIRNFWRAHWEHASWIQVVEMLRRGQLTEDEVWDWFRVVEIPPFWRQKLINISYAVPTRVDVRRWWDMRTIDEDRLREIYAWQGYHGKDLDDYVLWTKVYVAFPDLIARWKNGWITEDDVRNELIGLGMPADRVDEMLETKIKTAKPERVAKERDLTKTDIYRGVKKGVISWSEGRELLQDMGYDEAEAEYILTINVGATEGSPETYAEFKQWTQLYRKAQGLEAKLLPPEVLEAANALREARDKLREAEEKGIKNEKLAPYLQEVSSAEYRYRQLLTQQLQQEQT